MQAVHCTVIASVSNFRVGVVTGFAAVLAQSFPRAAGYHLNAVGYELAVLVDLTLSYMTELNTKVVRTKTDRRLF